MSTNMSRRGFLCSTVAAGFGASGLAGWAAPDADRGIDLIARPAWMDIASGPMLVSAYSGQVPGPAIQAVPGERVTIRFTNQLPESTNLHFHGLHVSPMGSSDNSFLEVPSGGSTTYELDIPFDHPGGTFWYHPHHHGMAAAQLSQGLAGVFLIRGVLDEIPEIAKAPEQTLVLQDFLVSPQGLPREPNLMEKMQGREGNLLTANGQRNPQLTIAQDGWLRLRLLNASASRFYRLQVEDHPFFQIASDGGALPSVEERPEIMLVPGERVEVMLQGTRQPGAYRLMNLPYDRGQRGMMRRGGPPAAAVPLATLVYAGRADESWTLPSRLTTVEPLPPPTRSRSFRLGEGMASFTINGLRFDPRRTDTLAQLNTVEEWEFINPTMMDHPMHIHTNPFQVIHAGGDPICAWKDVVLVRAMTLVRVRMRFADFAGSTMYHCHILDHEDLGMMGRLDIIP